MFRVKQIGFWGGLILSPLLTYAMTQVTQSLSIGLMSGIVALMASWWMSNAIPPAITSLLPIVLFPLSGIMSGKKVASLYVNDLIFLFIGGFIIALAIQKWNLHKRIAMALLLIFGSNTKRLLFSFMFATWGLSMWISNTATTMLMVPIALSFINGFSESEKDAVSSFSVGIFLGIAYSASIGGMATLIGTPPNLSFARIFEISFPNQTVISFSEWLGIGFPISALLFLITWLYLSLIFCKRNINTNTDSLKERVTALGKITYEEKVILWLFLLTIFMWVFRSPIDLGSVTLPGWSQLLPYPKLLNDGTIAIFISVLLFLIPARNKSEKLVDESILMQLPWGIILLLGGGFALASGFIESGLSEYIGQQLRGLQNTPISILIISLCTMMTFLTELTSNTATTELMLPILAALSQVMSVHPHLLMIPATISASCAFMLPVATAPNAIVFASKRVTMGQMVKTGFILNIIAMSCISLYAVLFLNSP